MTLHCYARGMSPQFSSPAGSGLQVNTVMQTYQAMQDFLSIVKTWTIEKAERQRIDASQLWCWRRLLRVLGQQGDQTSQA